MKNMIFRKLTENEKRSIRGGFTVLNRIVDTGDNDGESEDHGGAGFSRRYTTARR